MARCRRPLRPNRIPRSASSCWTGLKTTCPRFPVRTRITRVRSPLQRLTRSEYANTIRNFLKVDYDPAGEFPADESGYGFDNVGDVLSVLPLLLEKYLMAAEEIAGLVIDDPDRHRIDRTTITSEIPTVRGSCVIGSGQFLTTNGTLPAHGTARWLPMTVARTCRVLYPPITNPVSRLLSVLVSGKAVARWLDTCQNIVAVHAHVEPLMAQAGVQAMSAGCHVELPAMPRTRDDRTVERTFAQRAAGVRADSVKHVELAVNVEYRQHAAANGDFHTGATWHVRSGRNSDELTHGVFPLPSSDQAARRRRRR